MCVQHEQENEETIDVRVSCCRDHKSKPALREIRGPEGQLCARS